MMTFSADDHRQLEALDIEQSKAAHQFALLCKGKSDLTLERPCTPGDGIMQLQPETFPGLFKAFSGAAKAGRVRRFIPASGAATRMFSQLRADPAILEACRSTAMADNASKAELDLLHFLESLENFAFYPDLQQTMAEAGLELQQFVADRDLVPIIRYLLDPCGLAYSRLPKGLLAFHTAADGARTPFVEHLAEAALLNGPEGSVALHFTVSAEHLPLFKAQLRAWRATLETTYGCDFEVSFSTQKPSTDTLALDASGQPLRDAAGKLVLRPGGHGALIENLNDLAGDIILIRNIDNVVPDAFKEPNLTWTKLLTGYLLFVQEEQHALLKVLHEQPNDPLNRELALRFLAERLQVEISPAAESSILTEALDRPLRVCGMVANSGEPGGGPFWVRDRHQRLTRQIVEGAQIDLTNPAQAEILAGATHFNPVDMVCGVSDWRGRPYDLTRFVDEDAVIITSKTQEGEEIRVLELPGLWNGGMAAWHTLFVEIPAQAFNPVKTVFDLLRPAHQG